jgi:hypothetical protein
MADCGLDGYLRCRKRHPRMGVSAISVQRAVPFETIRKVLSAV